MRHASTCSQYYFYHFKKSNIIHNFINPFILFIYYFRTYCNTYLIYKSTYIHILYTWIHVYTHSLFLSSSFCSFVPCSSLLDGFQPLFSCFSTAFFKNSFVNSYLYGRSRCIDADDVIRERRSISQCSFGLNKYLYMISSTKINLYNKIKF